MPCINSGSLQYGNGLRNHCRHSQGSQSYESTLVRALLYINILVEAHHITRVDNTTTDALSCNKLDVLPTCFPQAAPAPFPASQPLLDMLLHSQPDWTSPSWRKMFLNILRKQPHFPRTALGNVGTCHFASKQTYSRCHSRIILCKFAAHLATEGLTHQTMKSYLSGVQHFHNGRSVIGNAFPLQQYVLRGSPPGNPTYQ
jgi:hypothetical protein